MTAKVAGEERRATLGGTARHLGRHIASPGEERGASIASVLPSSNPYENRPEELPALRAGVHIHESQRAGRDGKPLGSATETIPATGSLDRLEPLKNLILRMHRERPITKHQTFNELALAVVIEANRSGIQADPLSIRKAIELADLDRAS